MSKNSKRESAKKLAMRIVAGIMAALMVIGVIYMAIAFTIGANATQLDEYKFDTEKTSHDFRLAVGIRYGSSAYALHNVTSPNGFVFGEAVITRTEHDFTPLYSIEETDIAAVVDTNLTVGYQSCEIATKESETDIGGYHVQLSNPRADIWNNLDDLTAIFGGDYEHVFPAYIDGEKVIRIGSYPNYTEANLAAAQIGTVLDDFNISVASPSSSGVCFLNADYDTILFEYSGADDNCIGISPLQKTNTERSYLYYSSTSYLYGGVFCFKRSLSGSDEGLSMINLIDIQEYVEGVLPYEISSTWPLECLKAFSIMVRSYAMSNLNRHYNAYGFDICSSSCCQVYQGRRLVTDSVIEAVAATNGLILVYDGDIVNAAYSSSQGGYSVASQYVWGGALGYMINQPTPWEDYSDVSRGLWTAEITPQELAKQFKNAGYTSITGKKIIDFSYQTCEDSPYLYSFTGIDEKGNSATATRSNRVKSLFGSFVRSANFTMAQGELTYVYTDVLDNRIINLGGSYTGQINVYTSSGISKTDVSLLSFFTDLGTALDDAANAFFVKTGDGVAALTEAETDIPVSTMPDENGHYTIVSNFGDFLVISEVRDVMETIKASKPENYVIAGMGNGHGVGASQYGSLHLAKAGATYDQIVRAYYAGVQIVDIAAHFE